MAQNIEPRKNSHIEEAATPMNTPLNAAPISGRDGLPQPTVATIGEDEEEGFEGGNPASVLARNPALLNMMQDRLGALVGKPSGYLKTLPPAVRKRIDGLKGIQTEHAKIESEFQREILEIEKKFAGKYAPLYNRRKEIISGKIEPTEEEVAAGEAVSDVSDSEDEDEPEAHVEEVGEAGESAVKGVPEFWLTALKNHNVIGAQITEKDEEALRHLVDIRLEYLDTKQAGFKILFEFEANEFFEDTVVEKTYYYQEEVGYGGDFVYDKAVGHEIKWKEDKDLTKKVEIKKQRNKNTNRTRVVKKVVAVDSFFNFFKPPQPPSMEALEEGNVDEEELEDLDEKLEMDYQMGEDLKERIIPRAIDYFTGKALEYDDEMEEMDDEFDDEDYSDDDEHITAPPAEGQQDPQECKQQ